jgi:hypothetical protein
MLTGVYVVSLTYIPIQKLFNRSVGCVEEGMASGVAEFVAQQVG